LTIEAKRDLGISHETESIVFPGLLRCEPSMLICPGRTRRERPTKTTLASAGF
jgi:hypothetical protein